FGFRSAVQKQRTVAVSGSLASSVSLHVVLIGTGFDVPPCATFPMLTAVLLIAVLLSVTVQPKSPVPPVFWATYCTVSASAATLVPFTVKAFQPRHEAVPSSLLPTKPTSMNGPAPHFTCLSKHAARLARVLRGRAERLRVPRVVRIHRPHDVARHRDRIAGVLREPRDRPGSRHG